MIRKNKWFIWVVRASKDSIWAVGQTAECWISKWAFCINKHPVLCVTATFSFFCLMFVWTCMHKNIRARTCICNKKVKKGWRKELVEVCFCILIQEHIQKCLRSICIVTDLHFVTVNIHGKMGQVLFWASKLSWQFCNVNRHFKFLVQN